MREIIDAIQAAVQTSFNTAVEPELTRPDGQFGDFTTNVALQLAKQLDKPPREVAETVAAQLKDPLIVKTEVAGPGFINIILSDKAIIDLALRKPEPSGLGKVVVETNNPNPFKAMHIGHAFNAILGDTIANLLEAGGAETHRVSYHGDVGLHVGKSMWSILKWLDGDQAKLQTIPENERNKFMSERYAEGAEAYEKNPAAKAAIDHLAEESFTQEDALYNTVYNTCKTWSFQGIDEIVKRLGNKPIERRYLESEADRLGVETVQKHTPGVFEKSDGAWLFPGEKHGSFNNVFVSSRGRGLYGARDLGLMQLKHRDFGAEKSYIVTAEEQRDYFKGVIKAAELCLPELTGVTVNISTGTVKLSSGKMSSRTGDVVDIAWLFDQLTTAVEARGGTVSDDIIRGALRYEFLRVRIGSDVIFDVNESVSVNGNSGPYLQYAHARAKSILAKAKVQNVSADSFEPDERNLLRKIGEYPEVAEVAVRELMPHHICTYLHELAQTFNRFYEKNRVLDDPREVVRLQLVQAYADTLKKGLELLSIPAPEKM